MRQTLLRPSALCLTLLLALHPLVAAAVDGIAPSALDIFRLLPTSIFENTPEGLNEEEKHNLIRTGRTSLWRLFPLDTDVLTIESLPVSGSEVTIRLFHERNATIAAVGAQSRDGCALELWRLDAQGRLVPKALPPEPDLEDFFTPAEPPRNLTTSMQFCLAGTVLRIYPLFFGPLGEPVGGKPRNAVFYRWTGAGFEKAVIPLPPARSGLSPQPEDRPSAP